jgi:MinD-like ATPase involved in chromosome partitioning or flagellar assembly
VQVVRRCLDTADLLAAAATGLGRAAVVGSDAPRLDADVLRRLADAGVPVVGIVPADDAEAAARLARWGAAAVVEIDPAELGAAVRAVARAVRAAPGHEPAAPAPTPDRALGSVVAVWGTPGAPGRTTVAAALADEAARLGVTALLVDADTWAPSASFVLGVVDDGPGLASACRRAASGALDGPALTALARQLRPGLSLLPGIPRAGRWSEVRAAALSEVLATARSLAPLVVVDVAAPLESDEELVFDTAAPRRNAAALVTLEEADAVVAVGAADPLGMARLVHGLAELRDAARAQEPYVVVNRLRSSAAGRRAQAAVAEALRVHAGVDRAWCIPDDGPALDAALRRGRALADVAPASPARHALRGLAVELLRDLGLRRPAPIAAGE